jgi:maltoporin
MIEKISSCQAPPSSVARQAQRAKTPANAAAAAQAHGEHRASGVDFAGATGDGIGVNGMSKARQAWAWEISSA